MEKYREVYAKYELALEKYEADLIEYKRATKQERIDALKAQLAELTR